MGKGCVAYLALSTSILIDSFWGIQQLIISLDTQKHGNSLNYKKNVPNSPDLGPESAAFDPKGGGPYACVGDGRVVKYEGPNVAFTEFATTSPNRPSGGLGRPVVTSFEGKPFAFPDALVIDQERGRIYFVDSGAVFRIRSKERCDGTNDPLSQEICGRPYGLGFYDAYYGLVMAKPKGGLVTPVVTSFEGKPFAFLDSLDIDQEEGIIYFVDSGPVFKIGCGAADEAAPSLTRGLGFELWGQQGFLVTEIISKKIRRFWLKGPKANSSDVLANIDGNPDNIKWTISGDFWVAVGSIKIEVIIPILVSTGERLNQLGEVVAQYPGINGITEVQEHDGKLYVGSLDDNFIGVDGV
ncbi:hypothetical protein T459_10316 [Capsicum annuum]|uniref:Strictosidine synthase conserved region domain-containing protein n=1 Tax=Capsicum annuum TaxID=4072 RepID=A0A2G3A1Y1_CAPAN|nr:hypothetical protein T459_10316 [Capsicum annuum]